MTSPVRTGQAQPVSRQEFGARFRQRFVDPAYQAEREALARLEEIAWEAFDEGRKAPFTVKAGTGFADPTYDLSREWSDLHLRLAEAQARWADTATPSRVLLINASPRNDGSCPGEMSKTWRLTQLARQACEAEGLQVKLLDLSRITSDYDRLIHPCRRGLRRAAGPLHRLLRTLRQQPRRAGCRHRRPTGSQPRRTRRGPGRGADARGAPAPGGCRVARTAHQIGSAGKLCGIPAKPGALR